MPYAAISSSTICISRSPAYRAIYREADSPCCDNRAYTCSALECACDMAFLLISTYNNNFGFADHICEDKRPPDDRLHRSYIRVLPIAPDVYLAKTTDKSTEKIQAGSRSH